jgi:16S rRNA (uracil1498-N3)-methyltransferase
VSARFYVPGFGGAGTLAALPDEEARHATRVLRLSSGADILLFDGAGRQHRAVIIEADKRGVTVEVGSAVGAATELPFPVTLAQAALKADKMDDVVRDATMMGVTTIQPLTTARTEVPPAALDRGGRLERWQRIAVASTKQCGRAVVPEVLPAVSLETFLRVPVPPGTTTVMLVEPSAGHGDARPVWSLPTALPVTLRLVVGPEGGWDVDEQSGEAAAPVTLGGRTLRADAAATIALSALLTHWKAL